MPPPAVRPYDVVRKVEILGDLWNLTRKDHSLRLQLRTHPSGWELLAFVGVEVHRSHLASTEAEVADVSDKWRAEALAKGWAPGSVS